MEINKVAGVFTNKAGKDTPAKKNEQTKNAPLEPEASAQEIIGSYNQAFINKPCKTEQTTSHVAEEISDDEFERRLSDLKSKVRNFYVSYYILANTTKDNLPLAERLCTDKELDYQEDEIANILLYTTKENLPLAQRLCTDKGLDFPKSEISSILRRINKDNLALAEKLCTGKEFYFPKSAISVFLSGYNCLQTQEDKDNYFKFAKQLCSPRERYFSQCYIQNILANTTKDNLPLAEKLCTDKELDYEEDEIINILANTTKDNLAKALSCLEQVKQGELSRNLIFVILSDDISVAEEISDAEFERRLSDLRRKLDDSYGSDDILANITKDNLFFAEQLCLHSWRQFSSSWPSDIGNILANTNKDNLLLAEQLCSPRERSFSPSDIGNILANTNKDNLPLAKKLCSDKKLPFSKDEIRNILKYTTKDNLSLAQRLCTDKELDFSEFDIQFILMNATKDNLALAERLCTDKGLDFPKSEIARILEHTTKDNLALSEKLCTDKELDFPKDAISAFLSLYNTLSSQEDKDNYFKFAERLCTDKELDFPKSEIAFILRYTNKENLPLAERFCTDKELDYEEYEIINILENTNKDNLAKALSCLEQVKQGELSRNSILEILSNNISVSESRKLMHIMGKEKAAALSGSDFVIAAKLVPLYNKHNINEIPLSEKRNVVRNLVSCNADLFDISDELKQDFPLIPINQEEYCTILPSLVKSLGIETNTLTQAQTDDVYLALHSLSSSLASVSDEDFKELSISQQYPKSDFIKDTFNVLKDLPPQERQKVYDYFGFELSRNKNGTQVDDKSYHSFSITGYPVNLNNGKKLAQISDPVTKQAVETLRPFVIKYSENNPVSCSIDELNNSVNTLVEAFPELRTMIDRTQHDTHEFDIFKHSLKVMQKVVQNPQYQNLSDSDKNIMLLASLLHDINKREGAIDRAHSDESAFDAFFISNKLNLTKDEKIKLFSLIKHHEWLKFVNDSKLTDEEKLKRQKSVAFDLQYDNLFNLANIFTQADLKSVKADDTFFNPYNSDLISHSEKINSLIAELKTTQPFLPVTPFPKASRINNAITTVNADGSTNIKGVYKDKSGLIILKYNEIEDWEKIGFPKGSVSKGILAKGVKNIRGNTIETDVETGNIKFFAHGLDYENQLINFDAFALPDSDALLSVSYAERPESKYRFFRTQGVLLNTDAKYVHGGGNTDAGSGTKKTVQIFKDDYAFVGSGRHSDRTYVSDLIKTALNLTDEQYVDFVLRNKNRPMSEIEPEEDRNKIIKAFATINSNTRKGDREYNEMYITNPQVMAAFAYSLSNNVGDVISFVDNQKTFLKDYALENDLPFVVLGD